MRKSLAVFLTAFACLFQPGCSYSVLFSVVNVSNSPVEIEYEIGLNINLNMKTLENTSAKPYKTTLANWNKWFFKEEWQSISPDEYEFDAQTQKCKIKLAPNEVLRIKLHSASANGEYKDFNIKSVRLNGANGEVIYQGERLYKQFEKKDDLNYFITYR